MKFIPLKILKHRTGASKDLTALLFLCFPLLFNISCEKDNNRQETSKHSTFSIEKAKELFSQTQIKEFGAQTRDGEDEYNSGIHMRLGWDNGSEYHDDLYNLDVVEVPILESNLSKTFQVASAASNSNGYENNGQKERLLFTRDTSGGVKIAILKISGTIDYLATHNMKDNSFKGLDSDFEGLAEYYNLEGV